MAQIKVSLPLLKKIKPNQPQQKNLTGKESIQLEKRVLKVIEVM